MVVAGTKDRYIDIEILETHCEKEKINLHKIEGVGHRLEVFGDMGINVDVLKEIVELY